MTFRELAENRYSLRSYDPYKVPPREIIDRILESALLAPSACNKQPWRFLLLMSHKALEAARAAYTRDWFMDAPCILAVTGKKTDAWTRPYDGFNSLETDISIACTYVVLAAAEEGLGTCWIANFDPSVVKEGLGLAEDEIVLALTPLGYPPLGQHKIPEKKRLPYDDLVRVL